MTYLTPKEVAARARVSPSLVYAVLKAGTLPALRVGCRGRGKWLIRPDDFERWLRECMSDPPPPPELRHIR